MRFSASVSALMTFALAGPGALAREPGTQAADVGAGGVAQITAGRAADTSVGQISRPAALAAPGQLNPERGLRAAPQLNPGGRTAEQPAPLSTPAQGRRPATAAAIGGEDRCDPRRRPAARQDPDCARVLETRSAEFERPEAAPLSPEQRLLAERRLPNDAADPRAAARRAATGAIEDDDLASQAVAASVLAASREEDEEREEPAAPAANSGIAGVLVDLLTGGNGGGVVVPPPR